MASYETRREAVLRAMRTAQERTGRLFRRGGLLTAFVAGAILAAPAAATGAEPLSVAMSWSTVSAKTPTSWPGGYFATMSCPKSKDCWTSGNTVKYVSGRTVYSPIVEHWSGSGWALSSLGMHKAMAAGGISCASTKDCFMVGGTAFNGTSTVRIEHYNGTGWSQTSQTAGGGFLEDVACRSTTWCMAVGWQVASSQTTTKVIAERWNGTAWKPVSVPSSSMARTTLLEISCTSTSNCLALGQKFGSASTSSKALFSERWNGTKWSTVSIPTPTGGASGVIAVPNDLSCASLSSCVAIGYWYDNGLGRARFIPMAQVWNGSKWAQASLSTKMQSSFQQFNDVSCVSGSSCWIVGTGYASNGGNDAAVAYWNGSSFATGSVVRPGSNSELDAVHCVAGASCLALGSSTRIRGTTTTASVLGERVAAP